MTGDRSQLSNFVSKFLGTVKFRNDHVAKIMGYGDYQFENIIISRVYNVEGLGHNLFSVGKFYDSNLEVAFRQHSCFISNLEAPVRRIKIDNGTEFVNQTLREYYDKVGISLETSVACPPQQNGVVKRRNSTLIEAAPTMLIYARAPLFLWAEAVATASTKKAFQIYNRSTRRIIKTIHVDFDELIAMASEHRNLEPALHEMTLAIINSGLMSNPTPSTPYVPPSRTDWDLLFQPLFDELLNPPPSVDLPAPKVIAPIAELVALEPVALTKENHDLDVAHMNNDPLFGILILENDSEDAIPTIVHTTAPNSERVNKCVGS
ncbi:retrovirus-related pol polyprotein from transposon TNT 1-94 [Tanacetum coccineum]